MSNRGASGCPFATLFEGEKGGNSGRNTESPGRSRPGRPETGGGAETGPAKTCPLGFTSNASSSSRLSSFHCVVCRSILYLPHRTRCGHTFCLHCGTRSRSCVVCGDDVGGAGSMTADSGLQETLETFLAAHAGAVTFYNLYDSAELVAALKGQGSGEGTSTSGEEMAAAKATFYMTAGMASASGGNEMAAWHWYWLARAVYLEHRGDAEMRKRLGILYGVMGDLNKSLGYDGETVVACYERAVSYLDDNDGAAVELDESGEEFQRALSAVLNKAGEMHHYAGDVRRALEFYAKALDVRKARLDRLCAARVATEVRVSATLDVITSYAKVSDAQSALGMGTDAAATWLRGRCGVEEVAPHMHQVRLANSHATFETLRAHFFTGEEDTPKRPEPAG